MAPLLGLLALIGGSIDDLGIFEIVGVDSHGHFAGKYGKRMSERYEVQRDGKRFHVIVAGHHSRMADHKHSHPKAGDRVRIVGKLRGDSITVRTDGLRPIDAKAR